MNDQLPESQEDVLLKLTMPGKQLRESTVQRQQVVVERQQSSEPAISQEEGAALLSRVASGGKSATADFLENLHHVNGSSIGQSVSEPAPAYEVVVPQPAARQEQPILPVSSSSIDFSEYTSQAPEEKEVTSGELQLDYRGNDPRFNIFGSVQPQREDAKPVIPLHQMSDMAKDRVAKIALGMIGGDTVMNRLRTK